jgi:hypothetical protein
VIRIGGQQLTAAQYQYTLQDTLTSISSINGPGTLTDGIRRLPGLVDVTNNLNQLSPVVSLDIDRDRLAALGLSYGQIEDALQSAFSARQVSTIYGSSNQYQVILEVAPGVPGCAGIAGPPARPQQQRQAHPARHGGTIQSQDAGADGEPPGPDAVGDHFLQPVARSLPR